jgi:hypothetical protein
VHGRRWLGLLLVVQSGHADGQGTDARNRREGGAARGFSLSGYPSNPTAFVGCTTQNDGGPEAPVVRGSIVALD